MGREPLDLPVRVVTVRASGCILLIRLNGDPMLSRVLVTSLLFVACPSAGMAAANPRRASDARSSAPDSWLALWRAFDDQTGGGWTFEWNGVTGTPHRISGHFVELARVPTSDTADVIARHVVTRYAALLRARPADLVVVRAEFEPAATDRGEGTWRVVLRQVHDGVPVRGGSVRLVIRGRRLTTLGSDFFPGVDAAAVPAVSAAEASAIVERALGLE